jgi:predicted CXXCH cytochrome family protein
MITRQVQRARDVARGAGTDRENCADRRGRSAQRLLLTALVWGVLSFLCACDPLTVHKVTSTIFDGVPSMPPADQYCREFHEKTVQEELEAAKRSKMAGLNQQKSQHPPFAEKRCNLCHDKNAESGFVTALGDLCAHCHKGFPVGDYLHGPAAVGACLKCHLPHTSDHPSLLVKSKANICTVCHVETRAAADMHNKVVSNGMFCSDCHDPHGGNNHFFLK